MLWKLLSTLRNVRHFPSNFSHERLKSIRSFSAGKQESILQKIKDTWTKLYRKKNFEKVPPGYKMIYRSNLESYVDNCLLVGVASVLFIPVIAPWTWTTIQEPGWKWEKIESLGMVSGVYGSMAILYAICWRCPQRMYYSEVKKHFLVIMPRLLPYSTKSVILNPGTVKPLAPPEGHVLPWKLLEHYSEDLNTKLIVLESSFSLPIYYARLTQGLGKEKNNPTNNP